MGQPKIKVGTFRVPKFDQEQPNTLSEVYIDSSNINKVSYCSNSYAGVEIGGNNSLKSCRRP